MPIHLPKPVADYVAANARLDAEAMTMLFAEDALVRDNGKPYRGRSEIRRLFETEVIPVRAIFTPDTIRTEGAEVIAEGPAHGDFPGSPLRFVYRFTLEQDAIAALEIAL